TRARREIRSWGVRVELALQEGAGQLEMAPDPLHRELTSQVVWQATTRVAFRFVAVYLILYAAATQILGGLFIAPGFALPAFGTRWPMRDMTVWWADRVFRATSPLVVTRHRRAP